MARASIDPAAQHLSKMIEDMKEKCDQLVREQEKIDQEVKKYKDDMKRLGLQPVQPEDIVEINVGGVVMSTTRKTLMQVEGSLLEAMFSGRWEGPLTRDKNGRVFFDYKPHHMSAILDQLRARQMDKDLADTTWFKQLRRSPMLALVWKELMGAADPVPVTMVQSRFTWGPIKGAAKLLNEHSVALDVEDVPLNDEDLDTFVASQEEMQEGHVYYWRINIRGGTKDLFLGIDSCDEYGYEWSRGESFYGWGGDCMLDNGSWEPSNYGGFRFRDTASFKLDLIRGELIMRTPTYSETLKISNIAVSKKWRVFGSLKNVNPNYYSGDGEMEVDMVEVPPDEKDMFD